MTEPDCPPSPFSRRLYNVLLHAYPRSFRKRFGDGMRYAFASGLHEAREQGRVALVLWWLRTIVWTVALGLTARATRAGSGRATQAPGHRRGPGTRGNELAATAREARHAVRRLVKSPGFTLAAVLTLGLGVGGCAAVFSVVSAVLLESLPYPAADRLVALGHRAPGKGSTDRWGISQANYFYYRAEIQSFEDLGAFWEVAVPFAGPGDPERMTVVAATPSLFSTLGTRAALGRLLLPADEAVDGASVAVLSHDAWMRQFGGDRGVIGSTIRLNGSPREVVGVAAPGFHLPDRKVDVWTPLRLNPNAPPTDSHSLSAIARLGETATLANTRRELARHVARFPETLAPAYTASFMASARFTADIVPLRDDVVGDVRAVLWVTLGSVSLVLLIACANVANLLLVRADTRRREVALRRALGARRSDIARYLIAETMVLALAGGAVGVAVASLGVRGLLAAAPRSLPRLDAVSVDGPTLVFALGVSAVTGLVFGLLPLLRLTASGSLSALTTSVRGGRIGREGRGARRFLVVGQVAMAFVLLVVAGLMWRSGRALRNVDPGFDPAGALVFDVSLPAWQYREHETIYGFYRELLTRLEALPGVERAGGISVMPLEKSATCYSLFVKDRPHSPDEAPCVPLRWVAPGYFAAMRIPMTAGRESETRDNDQQNGAVVLSQVLAEQLWPAEDVIGKEVRINGAVGPWHHVIGVAAPVRADGLEEPPDEAAYFPLMPLERGPRWIPLRSLSIVVRPDPTSAFSPATTATIVRGLVKAIDPGVAVSDVRTLRQIYGRAMAKTTLALALVGIAAAVALVLGSVGIYGVIAWVVRQRTSEIGVRIALGGQSASVRWMVLGESMRVVAVGVILGLVAAVVLRRVIATVLFGVSGLDPMALGTAAFSVIAVAALASYLPARRAARVDPMVALRSD